MESARGAVASLLSTLSARLPLCLQDVLTREPSRTAHMCFQHFSPLEHLDLQPVGVFVGNNGRLAVECDAAVLGNGKMPGAVQCGSCVLEVAPLTLSAALRHALAPLLSQAIDRRNHFGTNSCRIEDLRPQNSLAKCAFALETRSFAQWQRLTVSSGEVGTDGVKI
eukprot:612514-Amphidinium_carterae.3